MKTRLVITFTLHHMFIVWSSRLVVLDGKKLRHLREVSRASHLPDVVLVGKKVPEPNCYQMPDWPRRKCLSEIEGSFPVSAP